MWPIQCYLCTGRLEIILVCCWAACLLLQRFCCKNFNELSSGVASISHSRRKVLPLIWSAILQPHLAEWGRASSHSFHPASANACPEHPRVTCCIRSQVSKAVFTSCTPSLRSYCFARKSKLESLAQKWTALCKLCGIRSEYKIRSILCLDLLNRGLLWFEEDWCCVPSMSALLLCRSCLIASAWGIHDWCFCQHSIPMQEGRRTGVFRI